MKNTKKVLSVALAGALAFGSVGAAFAAIPTVDTNADKNVAASVQKLSVLGMVDGYEDGKFHEEKEITRAEFAKLLVKALGLGGAADAAMTATQFNDVATDHWARGYINVAVGQGIIKGDSPTTFRPEDKVKYSEAITMLVRALGYKDEFLKGTWPGNYVAKAASLDITDNISFSPAGIANRGSVAIMLSNTLDAPVVKQDTFGDQNNWKEVDGKIDGTKLTLLEDKLDMVKYEELTVVGTPKVDSDVDNGQAKFVDKDGDEVTFNFKEGVSADNLLGASLNVYYDMSDKEVVYVEKSDKAVKEYYDVVDEDETISATEITLKNSEKTLKMDDNTKFYIDNKESQADFLAEAANGNLFVKVVLNDKGKVAVIDAYKFEKKALIAKSADASKITYVTDDADTTKDLKAKDYDKVVVMDTNGNMMKMEDIKADDIIYVNDKNLDGDDLEEASTKDEVAYVLVVRNKVEGKGQSWSADEFEIAGKDYSINEDMTTISVDKDAEFKLYEDADAELDDITDVDANVTALLDMTGNIRHIRADIESSSDNMYGIVLGTTEKYGDVSIKVLNKEGKEVEYVVDADDFAGGYTDASDITKQDVIKYSVDKDGKIDTIELIADLAAVNGDNSDIQDITTKAIKIDGKYYAADDSTLIFDYTAAYGDDTDLDATDDAGDAEIVKWADVKDKTPAADTEAIAVYDGNKVEFMIFTKSFNAIADDDKFSGYVVSTRTKNGDLLADIKVAGSDSVQRFTVKDGEAITKEDVITFTKNSKGEIEVADDMETATGVVTKIKGKEVTLTLGGVETTYTLDSDVVYYENDDVKDFSDLDEGDNVKFVIEEGFVKAVKLYE